MSFDPAQSEIDVPADKPPTGDSDLEPEPGPETRSEPEH